MFQLQLQMEDRYRQAVVALLTPIAGQGNFSVEVHADVDASESQSSVVELDRQANDLLDILVNGTLVAKGEIVEVNSRYGIRVVDVVAADRRLAGLERRS